MRYKGLIRPHHSRLQVFSRMLDLALIVASLFVSLSVYHIPLDREYLLPCFIVTALFSIFAENNELYQGWRGAPMFDEALSIVYSWLGAATLVISGFYLYNKEYDYSSETIELWLPLAPTSIILSHTIQRTCLSYFRKHGFNTRAYAILGANPLGHRLKTALSEMPWLGYQFVGFYDDRVECKDRRLGRQHIGDIAGKFQQLLERAKSTISTLPCLCAPKNVSTRLFNNWPTAPFPLTSCPTFLPLT